MDMFVAGQQLLKILIKNKNVILKSKREFHASIKNGIHKISLAQFHYISVTQT